MNDIYTEQEVEFRSLRNDASDEAKFRESTGIDIEYQNLRIQNVLLVVVKFKADKYSSNNTGAQRGKRTGSASDENMPVEKILSELESLANTAGARVADKFIVTRNSADTAHFIGTGKLDEIKSLILGNVESQKNNSADALGLIDTVIFDNDLSPTQRRNIEDYLQVRVIDRTALILDIFSLHAKSQEGKLQIELAQLEYMLPRLRGWGNMMSRQAGSAGVGGGAAGGAAIGSRGPGEKQLELDRRRINKRITFIKKQISKQQTVRSTKRKKRDNSGLPTVALVGYTNTGKSSILKHIIQTSSKNIKSTKVERSNIIVQNALFATLDTNTKKIHVPGHIDYLITDTVGFISRLPTQLIEAFRATLDEAIFADLLIHVVDVEDNDRKSIQNKINTVNDIIASARSEDEDGSVVLKNVYRTKGTKEILVFNKCDLLSDSDLEYLSMVYPDGLFMSAMTGDGFKDLYNQINDGLIQQKPHEKIVLLYDDELAQHKLATYYKYNRIIEREDLEDGIHLTVLS
ncbi:MAG: GTPase HflX [Bifidobacteriaceae bacterium]|jgi:GTP-binding protein HflX|nr:GTPase HflX [Bifidobacteriaceae bacterium]